MQKHNVHQNHNTMCNTKQVQHETSALQKHNKTGGRPQHSVHQTKAEQEQNNALRRDSMHGNKKELISGNGEKFK